VKLGQLGAQAGRIAFRLPHQRFGRNRDGEERLADGVMQIASQPLALVVGGQLPGFFVQARVLDGNRGLFGKGLQPVGMDRGEEVGNQAAEVDEPDHLAFGGDGHTGIGAPENGRGDVEHLPFAHVLHVGDDQGSSRLAHDLQVGRLGDDEVQLIDFFLEPTARVAPAARDPGPLPIDQHDLGGVVWYHVPQVGQQPVENLRHIHAAVERVGDVAQGFGQRPLFLFGQDQLLVVGDVFRDAGHTVNLSGVILDRQGASAYPPGVAVRADDAIFLVEIAIIMLLEGFQNAIAVFGVDEFDEGARVLIQAVTRDAPHIGKGGAHIQHLAGLDVA